MLKNLKSIFIFSILTFSNFTFATAPLKLSGGKLFDVFQNETIYADGIFSNHSTLEETVFICPAGYFQCQGTDKCCPEPCASICGGSLCCKSGYLCCKDGTGCCPIGYHCCGVYCCMLGQLCIENNCIEPYLPTSKPTIPPTPNPQKNDIFSQLTKKSKNEYRKIAANADGETPVYEYISTTGSTSISDEKKLKDIRTFNYTENSFKVSDIFQADHVFEAQILPNYLRSMENDGEKICNYILNNPTVLGRLKDIINDESNLRFLTGIVNVYKGKIFRVHDATIEYRNAVRDYLRMPDVYGAYSKTREKVIDFTQEVANEMSAKGTIKVRKIVDDVRMITNEALVSNETNLTYIVEGFDKYSRSIYEDLTDMKLPNNSFLILPLPYLSVIMPMALSLMFLFSDSLKYLC
ncbi:hypothetical protein GLOIN_2v50328 [Rhizophagus clarus]|uniref:Granulins domain-containing protein n=1 Tax=Rhizophagus clarus TaxID=94130 RepID=A0A8H3KVL5_9GLOM|nr:hypothetical protein GLOIN_2v50328 [Rhizophagus clarus]